MTWFYREASSSLFLVVAVAVAAVVVVVVAAAFVPNAVSLATLLLRLVLSFCGGLHRHKCFWFPAADIRVGDKLFHV